VGQSNQEIFSQRGAYLAPDVSHTLNAGKMERRDAETETFIAQVSGTLNANGKAAGSATQQDAETGMLIAFHAEAQADQLPTAGRDTSISDSLTTSQHAAVAQTLTAKMYSKSSPDPGAGRGGNVVAVPFDLAQITSKTNRSRVEDGLPAGTLSKESQMHVAMAFQSSQSGMRTGDTHATLDANNGSRRHNGVMVPVAFAQNTRDEVREMPVIGALAAQPGMKQTSYVRTAMQVRRLTPRECERLQGFPDDYTLIPHRNKPAADGPRYKALGNSMAVPVMRWIGERIQMVENIVKKN
jgi:DNA (cytosine-5)-methyltransferase 1